MKKIFVIDWFLIVVFIVSVVSGFGLHLAGHGNNHEFWHNWAVFHVLGSFLFFLTIILHVTTHWGWYKGIIKNGIGKRSKMTVVLSIIFILLTLSGIALFGVNGANSLIGLWHYKIGIVMTAISLWHIIKRFPLLQKSLNVINHKIQAKTK